MIFKNPDNFYLFFVLLAVGLVYIFRSWLRKKKLKKWLSSNKSSFQLSISPAKRNIKIFLQTLVMFFLILALSRPQGVGEKIDLPGRGGYILLLVDISNSMLVEDIHPNRLDFVKKELSRFLDLSSGDQFALVFFANSSVLASPFTNDLSAVKSYLDDLSVDYLTNQGTNFERAFQLSAEAFKKSGAKKNLL